MTQYTSLPQDDSNLDVTLTESNDLVTLNIQPAYVQPSIFVTTVNGQTGDVVLDTDDIDEGTTNLYYTDARWDARLATKTTTDLTEGTNLYYTDARVDAYLQSGDVSLINWGDNATVDWNTEDATLNINYGEVSLQVGQEEHMYAKASGAIANGEIVMFAGAQGDHLLVAKANPSSPGFKPEYIVGVATQDFANNEFGYVTTFGKVRDLDTGAYNEGDIIWMDALGDWTTTQPTPPQHMIQLAAVTRSHNNEGTIFVRPTHMMDTDETPEGSTNLYFTEARVQAVIDANSADFATTSYVDQAEADAITTANTYTDTRETAITSAYETYTDTAITNLVNGAPATLDTLNELAAALGDDPNYATTIASELATKATTTYVDAQDATTLSSANTYTDTQIPAVVTGTYIEGLTYDTDGGSY